MMEHDERTTTMMNTKGPPTADETQVNDSMGQQASTARPSTNKPLRKQETVQTHDYQETAAASASTTTRMNAALTTEVKAGGGHTEYWERLPSQQLSFGSSEILTIDECIQHNTVYRHRSIRVTGLLHQRNMQNDQVILQLKNPPLMSQTNTIITPSDRIKKRPPPQPFTPGSGSRSRQSSSSSKLLSNSTSRKRRRPPWFAKKSPSNTVTKTSMMPSSSSSPNNKNNMGTPKNPNPQKRKTTSRQMILTVIVDPELRNVSELVVGSLVMVIGKMLEDGNIMARLVQKAQPTDMTMYINALKARRKFLYQRYMMTNKSNPKDDENANDDSSMLPIQGCGPPPYERLLENTTE